MSEKKLFVSVISTLCVAMILVIFFLFRSSSTLNTTPNTVPQDTQNTAAQPTGDVPPSVPKSTAQKAALNAAYRQTMAPLVAIFMLCAEANPDAVQEPTNNGVICPEVPHLDREDLIWPDLSRYDASWGGCTFTFDMDASGYVNTFQFCATSADGTVLQCTKDGCHPQE
jgi:hypothetical protein